MNHTFLKQKLIYVKNNFQLLLHTHTHMNLKNSRRKINRNIWKKFGSERI